MDNFCSFESVSRKLRPYDLLKSRARFALCTCQCEFVLFALSLNLALLRE